MTKRTIWGKHENRCRCGALVAGCGLLLLAATAAHAGLTAAAKCEALKNQEAGKYAFCLEKAQMKLVKTKGVCSDNTVCYQNTDCSERELHEGHNQVRPAGGEVRRKALHRLVEVGEQRHQRRGQLPDDGR